MNVNLELHWTVELDKQPVRFDPLVFQLLHGVRHGGHLNYAAKSAGVSYRHAWGVLREWEARFGAALLSSRQGRGAHLTEFAETLLAIVADTETKLAAPLREAALNASGGLAEATDARRHPVTIVSSHQRRIELLRDELRQRHKAGLEVTGSEHALQRFRRGDADIAGFQLPLAEPGRTVAAGLISHLDGGRDEIWLLSQHVMGLLSRQDRPLTEITNLLASDVNFVNRQQGSATRLMLDALLAAETINNADINGYAREEYTDTAVAALIASGHADAGLANEDTAHEFGLHFVPLAPMRFYIAMSKEADSGLRRAVTDFCAAQQGLTSANMKHDEFTPTIAALKRIHRAGFWKAAANA